VQELLAERFTLAQGNDSPRQQLVTLRALAETYQAAGNYAAAESAYRRAIALARELRDTSTEAILLNQLSRLPLDAASQ